MSEKTNIEQKIEALEFELDGAKTFGKDERVKDIEAELKHWRSVVKKADETEPADKVDGVISEVEAAKLGAVDGEAVANERAEAHREQMYDTTDTPVIDEADAAKEPTDAAEKRSNERAAQFRAEAAPEGPEANIVTEADVVAAEKRAGHIENESEPLEAEQPAERRKRTTQDSRPRSTRSN